jgi:hypothetical protein
MVIMDLYGEGEKKLCHYHACCHKEMYLVTILKISTWVKKTDFHKKKNISTCRSRLNSKQYAICRSDNASRRLK